MHASPPIVAMTLLVASLVLADDEPEPAPPPTPRIESVVPAPAQPLATDEAVIWFDDFDGAPMAYAEGRGELVTSEALGGRGRSLEARYPKGERGGGSAGRKVFFGDSPTYPGRTVRRDEVFEDVWWRLYVKHQPGWQGGGPAKLSRATSLTSPRWAQAMIAHVWGDGPTITLDPVRCVEGERVTTERYNDWDGMTWLGNSPASSFPLHATEESGWWVCVEARVRLNTPGKSDGLNQLWIDGRLECERKDLDLRGSYTGHGINAVFLESYWNAGAPVTQSRWYDDLVISTAPVGPVACPPNPTVRKTPFAGPGEPGAWELELATDREGRDVVFRSTAVAGDAPLVVGEETGRFVGSHAERSSLAGARTYLGRVRQQGADGPWSAWSRWHQAFVVAEPQD